MPAMPTKFEFCGPDAKKVVPSGSDWIHEVKYGKPDIEPTSPNDQV
jgi:hypothetical protein